MKHLPPVCPVRRGPQGFLAVWLLGLLFLAPPHAHAQVMPTPLNVHEAVAITLRLQPALGASEAGYEAAHARVAQARSAWLPSLTGSLNYARQTANFVLRPGILPSNLTTSAQNAASRSASYNYWNAQLQLSQLVFDFGASYHAWEASRRLTSQSGWALKQARLEASLTTRQAFFDAQSKRKLCHVAAQGLDNERRHRAQIAGQVAVGARPQIDLAQAETNVSQAELTLINAANQAETARAALWQAMGLEEAMPGYRVDDGSLEPVDNEQAAFEILWHEALGARPEMHAQNDGVAAQRARLRSLSAQRAPQLVAQAGLTDAGQDLGRLAWNWNAGASLSWPLLAGGNRIAQISEARALWRQSQANANTTRNALRLELKTAQLAVGAAKQSVQAAHRAQVHAQSQLALAEGRYATGLGSVIELGDAQLAWVQAQGQQVQAESNLSIARAALIKALGRAS